MELLLLPACEAAPVSVIFQDLANAIEVGNVAEELDFFPFLLDCVPKAVSMVKCDVDYDRISYLKKLLRECSGMRWDTSQCVPH